MFVLKSPLKKIIKVYVNKLGVHPVDTFRAKRKWGYYWATLNRISNQEEYLHIYPSSKILDYI